MTNRQIEFYFDPVSPYVWLASTQLDKIKQQSNLEIIVKPVLFAGLLKAHGHKGPAEIPAKRVYTFTDILRRAALYGLEIKGPPYHPFNPLLALRACIAIEDNQTSLRFAKLLLDTAWAQGSDITREENVKEVAKASSIDPDWIVSRAKNPNIKQMLADATDAAIKLGIFGVPTFRVDNQIFWGDDRIDDLIRYLNGHTIDEAKLEDILSRGPFIK